MGTKDHKVVITKTDGSKKTDWMTAEDALSIERSDFDKLGILHVTVSIPKRK